MKVGRTLLRAFGSGFPTGLRRGDVKRNAVYCSMLQSLVVGHSHAAPAQRGRGGVGVAAEAASNNPSISTTAASAASKDLDFYSGAACIPSVEKKNGGEDAYFMAYLTEENTLQSTSESDSAEPLDSFKGRGYCMLGVSDGVGGWADMGVDAGAYSRQLMHFANQVTQEEDTSNPNPKRVLYKAVQETTAKGSATVCIVSLTPSTELEGMANLRAANLGDSGFIVVREKQVLYKSPVQQHSFNFPYQVSSIPKYSDNPMNAQTFDVEVAPGDTVVLATDGLFDNLYPEEVASIVHEAKASGRKPGELAHILAKITLEVATDNKRDTPFSYGARQVGFPHEYGGKMDDVTIVCSYVMADSRM